MKIGKNLKKGTNSLIFIVRPSWMYLDHFIAKKENVCFSKANKSQPICDVLGFHRFVWKIIFAKY